MTSEASWIRVTAIVRPQRMDQVCDGLAELGVGGVTVSDVEGVGQQRGYSTLRSGAWYQSASHPKVQIETIIAVEDADQVLALITSNAATGEMGDGKIWLEPILRVVSIRAEEGG
ncbi:P-II family nitrogen regulator [Acidithiobacillus sp. AMEEHan]|uniref:P-II family nitrogen regulator n=1 Tax=Acidithiobacillus sp. AMEEHan TaxID=2994951 RepID=UPI0027E4FCE7|nr:P-II family nitrogen regulator [Acidithiobacillus sp. AMEEHan]